MRRLIWLPTFLLVILDIAATAGMMLLSYSIRETILPNLLGIEDFSPATDYLSLWPALLLLVLLRAIFDLYPGYGMAPPEELRRQSITTALVVFFVLAGGALFQFSVIYSRLVLILTALLMFVLLPLLRAALKRLLSLTPFYGAATWIVGDSARADAFRQMLEQHRALGLRVVGQSPLAPPEEVRASLCLLVSQGVDAPMPLLLDELNRRFQSVWLVPNWLDVASVWVTARDIQGNLALEVRNNLLEPHNRLFKRIIDLLFALSLLVFTLPLMLFISLWIKLSSPGSVLLKQTRIGKNGHHFTIYKFRTMHQDAQAYLEQYLAINLDAQREWQQTRKLLYDPRVTRLGRILRRFSLDELPQLWNVLRGEMSFVGPRPIMPDELAWYQDKAQLYTQVFPGLTGLPQVSGRSTLRYDERVRLDAYYVRNWSIWLDVVIVSRTLWVVLSAKGAF